MTGSNKAQERDGRRSTRMRGFADTSAGVCEVSNYATNNLCKRLKDECLSSLGNREIESPDEIKPPSPD